MNWVPRRPWLQTIGCGDAGHRHDRSRRHRGRRSPPRVRSRPTPHRRGARAGRCGAARRQHPHRAVSPTVPAAHRRGRGPRSGTSTATDTSTSSASTRPGLYGHSHPVIVGAIDARPARRHQPSARTPSYEVRLARGGVRAIPLDRTGPVHQLRHRGEPDGAVAAAGPHRPRTSASSRGGYHGGLLTFARRPGHRSTRRTTCADRPYNDPDGRRRRHRRARGRPRRRPGRAHARLRRLHPGDAATSSPRCARPPPTPARC